MLARTNGDARVLVVEDDATHALLMRNQLRELGEDIEHAPTCAAAQRALEEGSFDVIVLDVGLPDGSGFDLQRWLRDRHDPTPVVFVTSDDQAEHAVEAVRAGAAHYVVKRPNYLDQMRQAVEEALSQRKASREVNHRAETPPPATVLVGRSPAIHELRRMVTQYGRGEAPVLVSGETGTGKELVARGLHYASGREEGPFVAVNCAAIPGELFESEVFGSARGAFTGAGPARGGLVGGARGGTLFLDEVGELRPEGQAKLLRLIESGVYRRVGESQEQQANVRIVAATNRDLEASCESGEFRADLYYRLNVLRIRIAPLRERRSDIPELVDAFTARYAGDGERRRTTPEALAQLMAHPWPGNIRELEHAVERTLMHGGKGSIERFDLDEGRRSAPPSSGDQAADATLLTESLTRHRGRLGPVAEELDVSVRTVQRRMKELGLRLFDFRSSRS